MGDRKDWLLQLSEEDISFLKRFILASGSLKELAQAYDISYPTVRLRLDRLIAKVRVFDSQQQMSDFERQLRGLFADGKIDMPTFKGLLAAHQRDLKGGQHEAIQSTGDPAAAGERA